MYLGIIVPYPEHQSGEETLERKIPWADSLAALARSVRFSAGADSLHTTSKGLIACTGDKVLVGQNVIFREEGVGSLV
jgi:hypothetical protein